MIAGTSLRLTGMTLTEEEIMQHHSTCVLQQIQYLNATLRTINNLEFNFDMYMSYGWCTH